MLFLLEDCKQYPAHLDVQNRCVVRARTEKKARDLANGTSMDEGKIWHTDAVTCAVLEFAGDSEVVCRDTYAHP